MQGATGPEQGLFEFFRLVASNRLATTAVEWATLFAQHNLGTLNNQWVCVDYNKFSAGSAPEDGCVVVLEQAPGYIWWGDVTPDLRNNGFIPSLNMPSNEYIFHNLSGFAPLEHEFGGWYGYKTAARYFLSLSFLSLPPTTPPPSHPPLSSSSKRTPPAIPSPF